ncbi:MULTISPECIES: hypothetical protein [Streptomyces]|uniref:hypothetical protein n=1 Tax=Streptomyces TaxID=1883 RepID=UPI000F7B28B0|nr:MULTISPECIES: hypothetical protein [Streptomyces]RST04036.1 hypothetical protein EF910_17985 [Streptomyces sp. WAC07149]GLX22243.1 hypothetical protein Slala01_58870 [Streptomyces lavendulae subsp. lavendulae]GLX26712.1 hypothetical protein Slala02_25320 [Streptomyces lavendulae subsp. lavendulae]
MRRAWRGAVLALAGAGLLTGCSAADLSLISVGIGADGTPQVTMAPCGDDAIGTADFFVHEAVARTTPPPGAPQPAVTTPLTASEEGWMAGGSPLAAGRVTFPLFSPPATWAVREWGAERSLKPGRRYSLSFHAPGFADYSGTVSFTAEDLAGLGPGEVWADGRAMSPKKFRKLVADEC